MVSRVWQASWGLRTIWAFTSPSPQFPVSLHLGAWHIPGFPGGSDGKVTVCNMEDPGLIPVSGRSPGEGNGNPLQYPCLEKSYGQRSLVGYSPWSCKESNTTEWLHSLAFITAQQHHKDQFLSTPLCNILKFSSGGLLRYPIHCIVKKKLQSGFHCNSCLFSDIL